MTKIAYNTCFGGFSLSTAGMIRYAEIKGIANSSRDGFSRTDPVLIQVIEEMGEAANGDSASLAIAELPKGTKFRIEEYGGKEAVKVFEDYEWETA